VNPYYETPNGALYRGDAFEFMEDLNLKYALAAKAVITDPPYGISLSSSGAGCSKTSLWTEIENLARFYSLWFKSCGERMLGDDGFLAVFGNYKSVPALYKAFLLTNFKVESAVIWDKEHIGPGMTGFRHSYEVVALGVKGKAAIADRTRRDVVRHKWQSQYGNTGHPAEKPVSLLKWLVESMTGPGDLVFDPFVGSGTTAVACEETGRRWLAVEAEERYCEIAIKRLAAVREQLSIEEA
jgi:DNA modification methylase